MEKREKYKNRETVAGCRNWNGGLRGAFFRERGGGAEAGREGSGSVREQEKASDNININTDIN